MIQHFFTIFQRKKLENRATSQLGQDVYHIMSPSLPFKNLFSSREASNCLTHAQSLGKDSVLSHTRFWLRSDHLLIDFLRNSFESRTGFKKYDDSCFATSSIPHAVVRCATNLKRPNGEGLFYDTLMFEWVVLPFSDLFGRKNPDYFCLEIYCCVLVISNTSLC